ncbi:putative ribonuclease H-like domain-containing protein [Tanacetum coccineum]|uniref:Ribonuclease H-like domain-containing protein n=1 Tax=Tanacetum coccineum TaxID=301880 RepID=A0ABQ5D5E1_9ASTR
MGVWPKCTTCNSYNAPGGPCRTCFNCNRPGHLAKDYRGVPRNMNPANVRNLTVRACYECGSTDHGRRNQGNHARGRAFMLGAEEARQDPNIVTGTFTLNDNYATTLFDSGADYCFVSPTFIPLLGIEPSKLGFKYEIEIASEQLVKIKGCKLEIEGHVFDIDLIPFGHGSFDVIIGMDWLSNYKAEIICHEKVVRIPLPDGKVLRVLGEKLEEKVRFLMSAKASDKRQEELLGIKGFYKFLLLVQLSTAMGRVSALKLPVLKIRGIDFMSIFIVASASAGTEGPIPPKTAEQKLARKNELKAKSTLMLAIPDEHLLKFYACKDAKSLWEAIKNRFGRNKESKKSRRPFLSRILKTLLHQVKKDWIKSMIAWNNIALIMRSKSDLDTLSMDDLYNNLKVYEAEIKGQSTKLKNSRCGFCSSENIANLEQIDTDDLEEMDLKWQVAMLTMRGHTGIRGIEFGDNARRVVPVETPANALMVTDGMGYDWSYQAEEVPTNFALMDYTSQGSPSSDFEVHTCSKDCLKSYEALQKYRESDEDDNSVNDRLKTGEGFHAVPPPYTENYMPPRPDLSFVGLDEYVFMTAVRKTTTSVPETKTSISKTSKDIIEKPKTVRSSAPLIEEWESDSEDDCVIRPLIEQNKPTVATKSGRVPVNAAKQSSQRAATSISTVRPVNIVAPKLKVNDALPITYSYFKAHSPVKRHFNQKSAAKTNNFNEKVNTARVNNVTTSGPKIVVSATEGNRENAIKSLACWIWIPTGNVIDHTSKDSGSYMLKIFDYVDLQGRLKYMTGNKFFLTNYQEIDGGFVAFGGSPKGDWLFDVDSLSISMNYVPVVAGNKTNDIAGIKDNIVAGQAQKEREPKQEYILIPLCTTDPLISQGLKDSEGDAGMKPTDVDENEALDKSVKHDQEARSESESVNQREMQTEHTNSSNGINPVSKPVSTAGPSFDTTVPSTPVNIAGPSISTANETEEQLLERFPPFKNAFTLPPVPNISLMDNTGIFGNAYDDEDVEEEVDMNNVISSYTVPDTSFTKFHNDHPEDQAIGTKWVFRNKKDERGIVVKNKAILVAQGHTQDEGIDYDEVFAPVARIEVIRLFLAYASFKDFVVYQMDVKSAFLYRKIEEEVYVCQPPSFEDLHFPDKVYKVEKALYGLHQAPRASQDKYVAEILKKFDLASVKTANTPMETNKALVKNEEAEDVDVHLYRSMIGSLMYLKASRPDIMFVVCACARFQVTPKTSHFNAVKRIFRYLKVQPKLGLWYPRDSPFDLEAFFDSDYVGASLDRKSTTGDRVKTTKAKHIEYLANQKEVGTPRYLNLVVPLKKVGDEAVHKELGDRMERDATTASSFEAEQDSGSGPRCQDTILGDVDGQNWFETTSKQFNNPPLSKVNTFGSGEDIMQLMELMAYCTKLCKFVRKKNREKCIKLVLLVKSEGSEGFYEIIDFITSIHIYYALAECPTIYISLIKQFWQTAALSTTKDGVHAITATIDGRDKIMIEASIRRHPKLQDSEGLSSLPNAKIFEQLTRMGYATTSDSLNFLKGHFAPQWKFFIHTILHCMSSKKTAWDQFSSNIATAIICLATNRIFNFSRFIFDAMVKNLDSTHKFLMYPRFIQILLNKQQRLLLPHTRTYSTPTLTNKLFNNMRRASKGYSRVVTPLFDTMLVQPQGEAPSTSPSRITSSPSLSSHPTTSSTPTIPPYIQITHEAEETTTMPHDSPLS